jgi:hypothetical protein
MRKEWIVAGALVISFLLATVVMANGPPSIDWWVIGGGSGGAAAGSHILDGTLGQAMVGTVSNGGFELRSGFWSGLAGFEIYLPLILRSAP